MKRIAIVGAGLTGATIARILADAGNEVDIFEKDKIGGMCADGFDEKGYIQYYGPHIFHTNDDDIFNFLSRFTEFDEFDHRVIADTDKGFLPWPINIRSMKKSYNTLLKKKAIKRLNDEKEDVAQLYSIGAIDDNFQTKAQLLAGNTLYVNFIKEYTKRQWGRDPKCLPSEMINRVEIREDEYDKFFKDKYVLMPTLGYSEMIRRMLYHHNIYITFKEVNDMEMLKGYDFIFNTAFCSDLLGNESIGELETIKIKFEEFNDGKYDEYFDQMYAVVNNCTSVGNYTRVTNMNAFAKFDNRKRLIAEIPSKDGFRLYPVRTSENIRRQSIMDEELKKKFDGKIINCGRCGGYKYINMDTAIDLAFKAIAEARL